MSTEKKSERMEVRLGYTEKSDFVQACDSQGDTPSGALRRFIKGYVRRAQTDLRGTAFRQYFAKRDRKSILVWSGSAVAASLLFVGVSGIIWPDVTVTSSSSQAIADAMAEYGPVQHPDAVPPLGNDPSDPGPVLQADLFMRYDKDVDGVLRLGEILPNDAALHRVLDLNSDGITLDEFWSAGRMDYKDVDRLEWFKEAGFPAYKTVTREPMRGGDADTRPAAPTHFLVEFDLSGRVPVINRYAIDSGNVLMGGDRGVVWEAGKDRASSVFSSYEYRHRNLPEGS